MTGFKNLSLEQKVELLPFVDDEIKDLFICDHPNVVIVDMEETCPDGVSINYSDPSNIFLVSTKSYSPGDVIYHNTAMIVTDEHLIYVAKVGNQCTILVPDEHFIHREGYKEMLSFDTYMNHSCSPSTTQQYHSKTEYTVYSKAFISPGDPLTCDYTALENHALHLQSLPTTRFNCQCGSPQCRGELFL